MISLGFRYVGVERLRKHDYGLFHKRPFMNQLFEESLLCKISCLFLL